MRFLLQTLSYSYLRHNLVKFLLTLLCVTAGVATFSSIRGAERSLVAGFQATIDRVAGKTHLQVTGVAGVPETLQEVIRELPGIEAAAPVIEQAVQVESGGLGNVLVLGVDLLGDHEVRQYAFTGDDADVDDPLLFLAQPDSIALTRDAARKAGLTKGDRLVVRIGDERRPLVLRAVLEAGGFADAFGGRVAVTDVYAAQDILGRGRRFDRIDVVLHDPQEREPAAVRIRAAIGPGYQVDPPERRGEETERLVSNFTTGLELSSGLGLGVGVFLVFNVFSVSVGRRRRDIGILRTLGATPQQVQSLFVAEAVVLGVVGGVLGYALGVGLSNRFLGAMADVMEHNWGLAQDRMDSTSGSLAVLCIGLGVTASVLGAWGPSRAAARTCPREPLAGGVFLARVRPTRRWRWMAGLLALLAAVVLGARPVSASKYLVMIVLGTASLATALLAEPVAQVIIARLAPILGRASPVCGQLATDSLLGHLRRTSGTAAAVTVALAFVIGLGSYFQSARDAVLRWTNTAMTSDLLVRPSATFGPSAIRYSADLKDEMLRLPGVRAVDGLRQDRVLYRGDLVKMIAVEGETLTRRPQSEFVAGDPDTFARALGREGQCAVSDNFARRFHVGQGDTLEFPTPRGTTRLRVAAVVTTFLSDRGAIIIARSVFASLWEDDRVDLFEVYTAPGADPSQVSESLHEQFAGRIPAIISARQELLAEVAASLDALDAISWTAVMISMAIACVGIVSSLLVSVVERMPQIGILKALGALKQQIRLSVVLEALGLAFVSFMMAVPLAGLLSRFLETTVDMYSGFRLSGQFPFDLIGELAIALPIVSILAAWIPARQAAAMRVVDAIAYE